MSTPVSQLDLKKAQMEYKRVNLAREELELRICEFQDNIKRLEANISIQMAKEEELQLKIKELQDSLMKQ